jgi:hypothetical protein
MTIVRAYRLGGVKTAEKLLRKERFLQTAQKNVTHDTLEAYRKVVSSFK